MPCYEVIGGVGKGGILVRTGRSLEAAKDTQRLGTGAIITELDRDGDRMQYRLLHGDGPPVGWVAVTFQDKALVKKLPGPDLQVQEKGSGFGLILEIHCEECFEEALDMMWCISEGNWAPKKPSKTGPNGAPIASDGTQAEAFVPSKRGQYTATIEMVLDKAKANPDEDEDDLQPPAGSFVKRFDCAKETRTTVQNMPTGRTFLLSVVLEVKGKGWLRSHWIRLSTLTVESRKPDLYNIDPFDNVRGKCKLNYCELFVPAGAWSLNTGSTVRCRKCGEKATDHEILNEPAKKVSSSKEDTKPVEGAQVWILALGTRGDQQPYVALGLALQRAGYRVRLFGAAPLQRFAATKGLSVTLAGKDWEEYGLELFEAAKSPDYVCEWWEEAYHEAWKTSDDFMSRGVHKWINHELPVAVKTVLTELKGQEDLPDLFIYNHLGVNAGISAWKTYGIRSIMAGLGTEPFSVTEGRTFGKKDFDNVDNVGVMPVTGETPLRWMSYEKFNEHCLEPDKLFGTNPMIKKLFTNDQLLYAKNWHYTGFWILEKDSQVSDATMFGGPDVMKRIADFMAAGPAPVYMGWGSMTKVPGKQMLRVGIGALKALGLRGIVSRGWAKLSEELLSEAVGEEDTDGLVAFAKANVLFVDKAPHEWLFPRCACTVHHGGAGTTAASLRAGVPVVITPIVYDQFEHARWVMQLGSGIGLRDLEQVDVTELEEALRKVTSSSEYLDKAKEVQKLIMEEDGAQGAVDAVTLIIRDQVRNGWAKKKWTAEKEKDKEDYDKWMKEEMQRRKERVKEMQRQRDPEYKRKKALNVDGKWLVWNSVWHAINTELATRHEGEAKAEYEEKAKLDGDRALNHFDTLIKENAVPLNVAEHIRDQAEAAGKAGANFVTEGQSLTLGDDIFLDDPPREMDTDLWQEMSMAIRVAARAVVEGCLDAHFLRKGNERWTITYDNYDKCKHDKKSKEILAEFEKDWAEKVAPDPSIEDAKDGDRRSTPVAKSNG